MVRVQLPQPSDSLAQLVEHLTFNQGVPGSSPGWITIFLYPNAAVAELADAPDLGSGVQDVQVQALSAAPIYLKKGLLHEQQPLAVEPRSGSSLESEVWSRMLNLQANF